MNRKRAKELLPAFQAFADGKEIQSRYASEARWVSIDDPNWNDNGKYRIKPKPREWEVLLDDQGWTMTVRQPGEGDRHWIKVREVLSSE